MVIYMSNTATTTEAQHAANIAELTEGMDDFFYAPTGGNGRLNIQDANGTVIYSIANAHQLGIRPETLTRLIFA
jgi:hypothetical protein